MVLSTKKSIFCLAIVTVGIIAIWNYEKKSDSLDETEQDIVPDERIDDETIEAEKSQVDPIESHVLKARVPSIQHVSSGSPVIEENKPQKNFPVSYPTHVKGEINESDSNSVIKGTKEEIEKKMLNEENKQINQSLKEINSMIVRREGQIYYLKEELFQNLYQDAEAIVSYSTWERSANSGIIVKRPILILEALGIRKQDILLVVNDLNLSEPANLVEAMSNMSNVREMSALINRGGEQIEIIWRPYAQ